MSQSPGWLRPWDLGKCCVGRNIRVFRGHLQLCCASILKGRVRNDCFLLVPFYVIGIYFYKGDGLCPGGFGGMRTEPGHEDFKVSVRLGQDEIFTVGYIKRLLHVFLHIFIYGHFQVIEGDVFCIAGEYSVQ